MSQNAITVPPPPVGILKNSIRPSTSSTAKSDCGKCSVQAENTTHPTTMGKEGDSEQSNLAACGEWLSCICGGIYFVICWSCTLSGEVKSHKEIRRGSAASAPRKGSTTSCTCRHENA